MHRQLVLIDEVLVELGVLGLVGKRWRYPTREGAPEHKIRHVQRANNAKNTESRRTPRRPFSCLIFASA